MEESHVCTSDCGCSEESCACGKGDACEVKGGAKEEAGVEDVETVEGEEVL